VYFEEPFAGQGSRVEFPKLSFHPIRSNLFLSGSKNAIEFRIILPASIPAVVCIPALVVQLKTAVVIITGLCFCYDYMGRKKKPRLCRV
jgi:hypothetical protein